MNELKSLVATGVMGLTCLVAAATGCSSSDDGAASDSAGGSTAVGATGGSASTAGAGNAAGSTTATATGGAATTVVDTSTCEAGKSNCFSFFVTSHIRLFALAEAFNGSTAGWGGDLRYGASDGLTGADKICTEIAEASLPGNGRVWKAFLSTSTVNAIDRVGSGPWYDRLNRPIANNVTELLQTRPGGIVDATIRNNLPNEDGTPHHNQEAGCTNLDNCADNHDVLTGSGPDGKVCTSSTCSGMGGMGGPGGGTSSVTDWTCNNWTSAVKASGVQPRVGHTWPTRTGNEDNWISQLNEAGCAPGINLVQNGAGDQSAGTVGAGGGYGAIYCFAISP